MNVLFHPEALAEFDAAVAYYNEQEPGLGLALVDEVAAAIRRIQEYPQAWSAFSRRTRRCLLRRFPYGIVYFTSENDIHIIAIAHLHRLPGYWRERLQ